MVSNRPLGRGEEGKHYRFPIYALAKAVPDKPGELGFVPIEIEGIEGVLFFTVRELAELVVEQANNSDGPGHTLLVIDDRDYLIETLKSLPKGIEHVLWNKPMERGGIFELQVANCFLGGFCDWTTTKSRTSV